MTLAEREQRLVEELAVLPDPQERLAHLVRRAARRPRMDAEAQVEAALVPGCVSRVWLTGFLHEGKCYFRVEADSPMVMGLIGLLCELYDGSTPEDAAAAASDVLRRTGLDRAVSPTRLHGLAQAQTRLRHIAAALGATTTDGGSRQLPPDTFEGRDERSHEALIEDSSHAVRRP